MQSLMQSIYDILGVYDYETWMEFFSQEPFTYQMLLVTGCVLICIVVSSIFKFLIKLVD